MERLNFYRMDPSVNIPEFATKDSACFDLEFNLAGRYTYTGYQQNNKPFDRPSFDGTITIMPGERVIVPTGLILDIPEGYSVRIHPRSGLSLKEGLIIANCEGVIDSDYVDELCILLYNMSSIGKTIAPNTRLAQAEMVKKESYVIWEIDNPPGKKTDRAGGMGSTGTQKRNRPVKK